MYPGETIAKDPEAAIFYAFDWSAWLAGLLDGSATIATHEFIVSPTGEFDLVVGTESEAAGLHKGKFSGGLAGSVYLLTSRVTTTTGETDDRSIYVRVRDR